MFFKYCVLYIFIYINIALKPLGYLDCPVVQNNAVRVFKGDDLFQFSPGKYP